MTPELHRTIIDRSHLTSTKIEGERRRLFIFNCDARKIDVSGFRGKRWNALWRRGLSSRVLPNNNVRTMTSSEFADKAGTTKWHLYREGYTPSSVYLCLSRVSHPLYFLTKISYAIAKSFHRSTDIDTVFHAAPRNVHVKDHAKPHFGQSLKINLEQSPPSFDVASSRISFDELVSCVFDTGEFAR